MLIGEYTHTLDDKGRVSVPAKFRKELGKTVVVTRGLERSLFVYSQKEWKHIAERLMELGMGGAGSRGLNRFMLSGAVEADIDSVGRFLIPDFLRQFAKLGNKVILAGVGSRIEVWNERSWSAYKRGIEQKADALAEQLGDVGAL